jgi:hypothetical protein
MVRFMLRGFNSSADAGHGFCGTERATINGRASTLRGLRRGGDEVDELLDALAIVVGIEAE